MVYLKAPENQTPLSHLDHLPIHQINQVQPHGVLLVLEEPDLNILQVSANTFSIFGLKPEQVLNQTLEELLDPFQMAQIRRGLIDNNLELINPTKLWIHSKGDNYVVFDAVFHRNADGFLILELEPAISHDSIAFLSFYHLARVSINQLQTTATLHDFCQVIVQEIRKATGFDRVMLYKFAEDQHGVVVAEDKQAELEPYLGLHYPASDIPKPARKLFSSNWIRQIPDAQAEAVELQPAVNPKAHRPLDLTYSILRSASPCHLEYLQNMGVGASLTISLIKDKKLWGLIACHHLTPKYVSYELRKACEFLGRVIFSELSAREETEDYGYRMKLTNVQTALIDFMSEDSFFVPLFFIE